MIERKTKIIEVGKVKIGGNSPISVQSMTNTDTRNIKETINQIERLCNAGCDIVRLAIPDAEAAQAFGAIKKKVDIPLAADIHFDYRLAIKAIENGADKIRINPGNIGSVERVKEVVEKAKEREIPIRIGVNSGSLEKEILAKYKGVSVDGLVESAIKNVRIVEDIGYDKIVVSIKASDVITTIASYREASKKINYPLHLGVTEAGTVFSGTIKSSIGIGTLLADGIGDTIRVSLTADPVVEVKTGIEILKSLGLREQGINLVSCPTCGRCKVNLVEIVTSLENIIINSTKNLKIAVMGCAVNGPGEARDADIGVACGDSCGLIFKKGEIIRKVPEDRIIDELLNEIEKL
ncbi:MAG: flavodoxin-dependent (E)-4-hydroxy-3-methylbut-2-enyl-diphosphate synthase [Deltaproteobacteria bacterium]